MCGFVGTSHECEGEIRGKIIFVNCSEKICNLRKSRFLEMNIMSRDGPDRDGYLVYGTCYDKLEADNEIYENCFCISCYAASDEFCDRALPKK